MSDEFLGEIIRKSWKRKLNTLANVGALVAAPLTSGGSLAINAARTGAMSLGRSAQKKLMGRTLANADKNLASAKKDAIVADKVGVKTPRTRHPPGALKPNQPLPEGQGTLDVGIESSQPSRPMAGHVAKPDDPRPGGGQNITGEGTGQVRVGDPYTEAVETQQRAQQNFDQVKQNIEQADLDNAITQQGAAAGVSSAGAVVGADIQQRAEQDRQRTEADYEKAREAAGTGGAKSTTTA